MKAGYKKTEIGIIPGDWEVLPFRGILITNIKHGIYKNKDYITPKGIRILKMGIHYSNNKIGQQEMERISITENELNRFRIKEGNLIFSRTSMMLDGAGKCSIVISHKDPIIFDGNLLCAELNEKIVYPKYYFYFFNSNLAKREIAKITTGTQSRNIAGSKLMMVSVPIPQLPEQKAIAKVLSDLDDKIELNNEMNKTLEEVGQALFKRWFIDFEFPDENGNPYRSSGGGDGLFRRAWQGDS